MRNFFLKVFLTCFLSIQSAGVFAQNVERILFAGSELLYPLPEGFCNITEDLQGIVLKEILDKQKNPIMPVAQLIIGPCQPKNPNSGYPWGWVGLNKDGSTLTQETVNRMMAKLIANGDLLKKLERQTAKKNSEALNELFGIEASMNANEQRIVWADKDSILILGKMSSQMDGKMITEIYASSTTVIEDLYIYTYLYNLEGAKPSAKQMSKLLIDNAPALKKLN
jgi:hypothetical protein